MQSVVLPCKAVLPYQDPERVRIAEKMIHRPSINQSIVCFSLLKVMWYKLINSGQSSTLSVSNQLITKDSRFSVAYYSIDHGFSPAKWDLHITNVRLSDAAHYQCHVTTKDNRKSIRSNVKLVVEGKKKKTHRMHMWIYIHISTLNMFRGEIHEKTGSYLLDRRDNHGRVKTGIF